MVTRKLTFFAVALLFVGSLWLVNSSAAPASRDQHFGPFAITTPDNGSCGVFWATDTFDRFWNVHNNGDGTFSVDEQDKNGSFVALGGGSPGACESGSNHGSTVDAGVTGTFIGYVDWTVTGGSYNPAGCSAVAANCSTRTGFFTATFPGGAVGCGPSGVCKFGFEYASGDRDLLYHHWADVSDKDGNDLFRGDIANQ